MYFISPDGQVGQEISRMHLAFYKEIIIISPDGSTLTLEFDTPDRAKDVIAFLHTYIARGDKSYDSQGKGSFDGLVGYKSTTSH